MQVACQCGQSFTVDAGPFPRTINCHACGNNFTILDSGETLGVSTISDGPTPSHSTPNSAICTDANFHQFTSPQDSEDALRLFEHQLTKERASHLIAGTIRPSRSAGLVIAAGFGGTFLTMMAMEAVAYSHVGNPVLITGAIVGLGLGVWLYRRGKRFDAAQVEWDLKRWQLHAKYHFPPPEPALTAPGKLSPWTVPATLFVGLMLYAICFSFFGTRIHWVGGRDLEITFVVTDAQSGKPIHGASLEIAKADVNWCQGCDGPMKLVTNNQGVAKLSCKDCMCSGTAGWVPFFRTIDTFGTHYPDWNFEVLATDYQNSGPLFLYYFHRTIDRGDKATTMRAEIKLDRVAAAK